MMTGKPLTQAESCVLEAVLPAGMTPDMRDVALCMFEALALHNGRSGQAQPEGEWLAQLQAWAQQVLAQMQHLASQKGGAAIYFAKGVTIMLTTRDLQMCARFNGSNYDQLARQYDLTEMRVRQIIGAWQRSKFDKAQGKLDLSE